MTSGPSTLILAATSSALTLTLFLAACGTPLEEDPDSVEGGSAGGGMDKVHAAAPDPAGDQHSHDQLREALEETIDGADITDTDDWWESMRDLNRELQKLQVDPAECKSFVTASAQPVPSGALAAIAQHAQRQTAVYTFEDSDEAQSYVTQEFEGVEACDEHTVTRELHEDEEVETTNTLDEVEIRSGAEDALAVSHVMDAEDETQHGLTVLLRQGSTAVAAAQTLEEPLEGEAGEDLATELEAEAAAVLSTLTGEEITAPEPEPEDEESEEEASEDGDSGAESDGDGSGSGDDQGSDSEG